MTAGLPLMKSLLPPFAKSILIPLGLSAAMSATDAAIQKKLRGSGITTSIISNEEMEDIIKVVKSLEKSGLLVKGISETIKNETKEQKGGFPPMLLGTLAVSINSVVFIQEIIYLKQRMGGIYNKSWWV